MSSQKNIAMEFARRLIMILLLTLGMGAAVFSQDGDSTQIASETGDVATAVSPQTARKAIADSLLGFRIAPLDTLMARAIANSPELRGQDALINSRKATLRYQNRTWLKMFQPIAGVSYGTGTIIASVDDGSGASVNLANQQNLLYNVGITVRFTAEDFFNRGPKSDILEWEIEKLHHDRDVQIRLIRERVIMRYEALLMAAEVAVIKAKQWQTNLVNQELSERYFHSGDMSYADYNGVLGDQLAAEIQFINAKSSFQTQYLLLREIVGQPLY